MLTFALSTDLQRMPTPELALSPMRNSMRRVKSENSSRSYRRKLHHLPSQTISPS